MLNAMLAATVGLAAWSAKKVKLEQEDGKIPLMGVVSAVVPAHDPQRQHGRSDHARLVGRCGRLVQIG